MASHLLSSVSSHAVKSTMLRVGWNLAMTFRKSFKGQQMDGYSHLMKLFSSKAGCAGSDDLSDVVHVAVILL